ncbi:MAG: hypothetical protein KatS3mg109_1235 [Pirellulaceae bacterium]|nr:MAG: hypothetical protein KatS3mg109_1235 [Pirellulaceae bacterium]GIW94865.1 MAG: hypothetical protein KatS3mg110_2906 [Pirellulaceae bacterium]
MNVAPAACSGSNQLRKMPQPGWLNVLDRGYANFALHQAILDAASSAIGCLKDKTAFAVAEDRRLLHKAVAAGPKHDFVVFYLGICPSPRLPEATDVRAA